MTPGLLKGVGTAIGSSVERAPWGWLLTVVVLGAIIRGWPAIVDAATRAKTALGDRRLSRIESLEMKLEAKSASYEAEVAILRHQFNNVSACLDALLLLIETAPEQASAHAARIRAMRKEQSETETVEKATIRGARIAGAAAMAGSGQ